VVAKNGGESDADFFVRLTNEGVNRFRYRADAAAVAWAPGTVVVDPGTVVVVVVVVGDPIGCICAVSDMFGLGYPEGMFTDDSVQV